MCFCMNYATALQSPHTYTNPLPIWTMTSVSTFQTHLPGFHSTTSPRGLTPSYQTHFWLFPRFQMWGNRGWLEHVPPTSTTVRKPWALIVTWITRATVSSSHWRIHITRMFRALTLPSVSLPVSSLGPATATTREEVPAICSWPSWVLHGVHVYANIDPLVTNWNACHTWVYLLSLDVTGGALTAVSTHKGVSDVWSWQLWDIWPEATSWARTINVDLMLIRLSPQSRRKDLKKTKVSSTLWKTA